MFLNAALIFWVELLFAKRLLPALGGSPAVWNTSLMFYQVILLAGYAYVLLIDRLPLRRQYALHAGLLLLAAAVLPWSLFLRSGPGGGAPVPWLLALLTLSVGLPFFVLAAGAPLLQRWFSYTGHREGGDPYFLYAASNLGSFLALAAYPLLLEPLLGLDRQTLLWKCAFLGVSGLVLVSGGVMVRRAGARAIPSVATELRAGASIAPKRRWQWILLSFVPSSLLLGVTTHITSEIAPVPLLWVVPLGLYLITFIVAFGTKVGGAIAGGEVKAGRGDAIASGDTQADRGGAIAGGDVRADRGDAIAGTDARAGRGGAIAGRAVRAARWSRWGVPALSLALIAGIFWTLRGEIGWLLILGDLAILSAAGLLCHGRLAQDRPGPERLAEFYLWIALGGALGGVFNTLIAPLLFEDPLEYPLVLALFAFLVSARGRRSIPFRAGDLVLGVLPGLLALALAWGAPRFGLEPRALFPLAGIACLALAGRPVRFGLGVAGLVLVGFSLPVRSGEVVFRERTFYGIHRIYKDEDHLWLAHGSTVHGGQRVSEPGVPLTYYHPEGPAGALFSAFQGMPMAAAVDGSEGTEEGAGAPASAGGTGSDRTPVEVSVALVGLGTGSLLAYGREGEQWTLYELDPTVARIAGDTAYFSYLADSPAEVEIVLGDARLSMAERQESYDLIVIDAFSSDAIPVHLLTEEAIRLYRSRLRSGGWIAFHTSNRYADFSPVLARLASAGGLLAFEGIDSLGNSEQGRYASSWVLLTEGPDGGLDILLEHPQWKPLPSMSGRVWTDSYSSIFQVLRRSSGD